MSYPKGKPRSEETKIKLRNAQLGKKHSAETLLKMSIARRGKPFTEEHKRKMSEARKGYRHPKEVQDRINATKSITLRGANSHLWKGGITTLHTLIRTSYRNTEWIKAVLKKDNYTCQDCGELGNGINLQAHHKKPFAHILKEFLDKYNQFSPIEDKETLVRLAETYEPFWEIINGKTLCEKCHNHCKRGKYYGMCKT